MSAVEPTGNGAATAPLVDATEAGRLLAVPKSWVLAEARAGRIPHVRLGRYVRFEPAVLEAWWQGRRRGPQPKPAASLRMGADQTRRAGGAANAPAPAQEE